jgi:hypothetical protein
MDKQYGLKKVYVFTRYPMLGDTLREDGKYNTGMMVYAWYIFENHFGGAATIDWIDNNKDVLSKKDKIEDNVSTLDNYFEKNLTSGTTCGIL